jgi:hypothetical protein
MRRTWENTDPLALTLVMVLLSLHLVPSSILHPVSRPEPCCTESRLLALMDDHESFQQLFSQNEQRRR